MLRVGAPVRLLSQTLETYGRACSASLPRGPTNGRPLYFRFCVHGLRRPKAYLLFFFSGLSGLIYQVVWVRMFGNVFVNTSFRFHLVAVFMLGLGAAATWRDAGPIAAIFTAADDSTRRTCCCAVRQFELPLPRWDLVSPSSCRTWARSRRPCRRMCASPPDGTRCPPRPVARAAKSRSCCWLRSRGSLGGTLTLLIRHLVRRIWRSAGADSLLYGRQYGGRRRGGGLDRFHVVPGGTLGDPDDCGGAQRRRGQSAPSCLRPGRSA